MRALTSALAAGVATLSLALTPTALAGPSDPDPRFGQGGVVLAPARALEDVQVRADGTVVAAGTGDDARGTRHMLVVRYAGDGTPDTTLNGTGRLLSSLTPSDAVAVGTTSDGRIVVVGTTPSTVSAVDTFVVERYSAAGALDPTFNPSGAVPGRLVGSIAQSDTDVADAVVAPDGTVIFAGTLRAPSGLNGFVARVTPAGVLDTAFGGRNGVRAFQVADQPTTITSIAVNATGQIAVGGEVAFPSAVTNELAVARLTSAGALDTTFNASGPRPGTAFQRIDTGGDGRDSSGARAVAIDATGGVTAAGYAEQNSVTPRPALARFNASGTPELTFGTGGYVKDLAIGAITDAGVWDALDVDATGALTVAGRGDAGTARNLIAARYSGAGEPDPAFNGGSHFRRYTPGTGGSDDARAIARTPNEALVLAGASAIAIQGGAPAPAGLLQRIGGTGVNSGVPPTAGFTVSHAGSKPIRPNETVTFTSTATDDGAVVKEDWDLIGGPDFETSGKVVTQSYPNAGPVTVTHRVTDNDGLVTTITQTFGVFVNTPPVARLGARPAPGSPFAALPLPFAKATKPYTLRADASTDEDGSIERYAWDLDGNGSFETDTGTEDRVTTTFNEVGKAHVAVRVTDDEMGSDVAEGDVTVVPVPRFKLEAREGNTKLETITVVRNVPENPMIVISRIDNSTGPVDLSFDSQFDGSLQPLHGVSIQFFPETADRVRMQVAAKSSVPLGTYSLTVRGTPRSENTGPGQEVLLLKVRVVEAYDARITGMEVTQGAQGFFNGFSEDDPSNDYLNPGPEHNADPQSWPSEKSSSGGFQPLVRGPRTIVRGFATLTNGAAVKGVTAALYGSIAGGGKQLGVVGANGGPFTVAKGPAVVDRQSARVGAGRFTFTLPGAWLKHPLDLRMEITTPAKTLAAGNSVECFGGGCDADNDFTMTDIPFADVPILTFQPIELRVNGKALPSASDVFSVTRALTPLGGSHFDLRPYAAVLDITDVAEFGPDDYEALNGKAPSTTQLSDARNGMASDRLKQWSVTNTPSLLQQGVDSVIGVNATQDVARGFSSGSIAYGREETAAGRAYLPAAVVANDRPITSVAHELGHQIGRSHADTACGGNGDGGTGEIKDDGIDRRLNSNGAGGYLVVYPSYLSVPDPDKSAPNGMFDYMSYCAAISGTNAWIGTRGWTRYVGLLTKGSRRSL